MVIFLDSQHRVITHSRPFSGTLSHVEIHSREIIREAIKVDASAPILVHNHPPGYTGPSKVDKLITEWIIESYQFMDLRVFDHIVIGRGEYVSFAECGWIQPTMYDPSGPLSVRDLGTSLSQRILHHL